MIATETRTSRCSGCLTPFTLNVTTLVVATTVEVRGPRGGLVETDVEVEAVEVGPLIEWTCPGCGYAESEETDVEDEA